MIPYPGDPRYASTRLVGTVVLHNKEPVEVQGVYSSRAEAADAYHAINKPLPDKVPKNPTWIKNIKTSEHSIVSLEELDVTPFKLGYVNYKGVASYVVRV